VSEFSPTILRESASHSDFDPHGRIDALQSGACTEDDFVREVATLRESAPNLVWTILALLDQRYRLGHLPADLFLSIKTQIARHALEARDDGNTIDLQPDVGSASRVTEHAPHPDTAAPEDSFDADCAPQIEYPQGTPAVATAPGALRSSSLLEPGGSNAPSELFDVGRVIGGRYVLESVLGRGGMGTVFKALDRRRLDLPETNRRVALKVQDQSTSRRADLRREFYCAQALAHPHIVQVYEMHQDEDAAFYTMELLEGQLLSSVLERTYPHALERPYAWAIIRDVGAALTHAHSRHVVHGDLKPQNIMITDTGEVRILDFGASGTATRQWATADTLQRDRFPPVTLAYACCELLDGQQTDPRDDLYALACLSYELLAGEHPFQRRRSTEARELGMRPARPKGLSGRQWGALQLGLSWRRENRSLSVRDWLAMLALAPAPGHLPPLHAAHPFGTRSWTGDALRPAALIMALIAALGLWAALSHGPPKSKGADKTAMPTAQLRPASAATTPGSQSTEPDVAKSPPPTPMQISAQPALPPAQVASAASHEQLTPASAARDTAPPALHLAAASQISLTADTYRVRSDENFVEINVRRSIESRDNSGFVWWTEAASARPGSDFVPQPRTTQLFLKGRHSAKLFVRILPNQLRTRTQMFYVHIGASVAGYALGPTTRAAILIPPLSAGPDSKPVYSAQRSPE
jgi:serine/threonine protein kinase